MRKNRSARTAQGKNSTSSEGGSRYPLATKEKFIELQAKGESFTRIAKKIRVARQTLITWNREFKLEIADLKAVELEALREKYYLQTEKRIELFGREIVKMEGELGKRDYSSLSTEKLIELFLKMNHALKAEDIKPYFEQDDKLMTGDMTWAEFVKMATIEAEELETETEP